MRLAWLSLITLFLLRPMVAQETTEVSTVAEDSAADAGSRSNQNAAPEPANPKTVLDVKPGNEAIKDKDLYDQTGVWHPFLRMPRYFLYDQKAIWTSPFHTSKENVKWWIVMGGATGALIAADKHIVQHLPTPSSTLNSVSNNASSIGSAYSLIPISAGFYFIGSGIHDEKMRETGLLSFEALVDTAVTAEVLKLVADRARPYQTNGTGRFEDNPSGRWSSGFPSGHAITTWALASVVAHEYGHRKLVPIAAYGLALTVSFARVGARQHFPSDVVAGSAMGWFIGDFVYGKRSNEEIGGKRNVAQTILSHIQIGGM